MPMISDPPAGVLEPEENSGQGFIARIEQRQVGSLLKIVSRNRAEGELRTGTSFLPH